MLTDDQVKEIIVKEQSTIAESLMVIERYIFDRKGAEVKINMLTEEDIGRLHMMHIAYNVSLQHYKKTFNI